MTNNPRPSLPSLPPLRRCRWSLSIIRIRSCHLPNPWQRSQETSFHLGHASSSSRATVIQRTPEHPVLLELPQIVQLISYIAITRKALEQQQQRRRRHRAKCPKGISGITATSQPQCQKHEINPEAEEGQRGIIAEKSAIQVNVEINSSCFPSCCWFTVQLLAGHRNTCRLSNAEG